MPIKSKAQRRKFAQLLTEGKISEEVFERWNREAGSADLPEHVRKKKTARKKIESEKKEIEVELGGASMTSMNRDIDEP